MISALGSHRFNPQTGLWELVTLENAAGVEMTLPAVAAVGGVGADGPATALPEPVTPPPSEPVSPAEWWEPAPDGFRPPTGFATQALETWVNSRTGERFVAPSGGWTNDDPDWGHIPLERVTLPPSEDFAIAPALEPDVVVMPETIIVCNPPVGPELVTQEEPVDILIGPWGWAPPIPPIPPTIIERPDGLIIIGGNIHSVLEGGDGNDLIIAGASADHPGNWYTIGWSGSAPYYSRGDSLVGGLGQDTLIGNDLNNRLEGGAGADVMIGGGGTDVYVVDDAGDRVIEVDHGGYDRVFSSVSYILADNVEGLTLADGAGDINGAGNNLNNVLIGNEGRNILSGGAGNDWLHGGNGDTFIGGEGRDTFLLSYDDFINYPAGGANAIIADFQVGVDKIGYRYEHRLIGYRYEYCYTCIEDAFLDVDLIVGSPSMRQDGADTFVTWGQGEIRLIGVDMRLLGEQDFFVDVTYPFYFY